MKIGQVVKNYGISANSLYFYINNGLLVPPRRNNQYVFDERTIGELKLILELKQMDMPLKTIHRILSLRRISGFCSKEDRAEIRRIYVEHDKTLHQREEALAAARKKLWERVYKFESESSPREDLRTGVPIRALSMVRCPHCGGEMMLDQVNMSQRYIFQGKLTCSCGYSAQIKDGVLETGLLNQSQYDCADPGRELYRNLPSDMLSLFEQSYRWLEQSIHSHVGAGKVWLEPYVNAWFFFQNHLELLHEEDTLIVVDKFPETLQAYKSVIEWAGPPCDILYIAAAGAKLPLREQVVDCTMDFFSDNEHTFYEKGLYIPQLRPYLKEGAELFGVYFYLEGGERSLRNLRQDYPESEPNSFNVHWFLEEMGRDFRILETEECGVVDNCGHASGLRFHAIGDMLHLLAYHGLLPRGRGRNP